MKFITIILFAFISLMAQGQANLTPGKKSFEKKWIKDQTYTMKWFALRDTVRFEIGTVDTKVIADEKYITIVTEVKMKNNKAPWIDSTIADIKTLTPVRHTSSNAQRNMVVNFGCIVTGSYHDNVKQEHTVINDTTEGTYFDSNIYPALIQWLPLKEGYKKDIAIYDYNPSGKIGVITASVKEVTSGVYNSQGGPRDIWIVRITDEISGGPNDFFLYHIDKADRTLWKQEISVGGRKMVMVRVESNE